MRSINKVIIIGNLTRDPELRQTPNGQNVVTFGLATNREWVTRDGRKQTSAEFHDLVAWAKLAEICHQYLKKGKLVYVEGYLKTRSWDTPEGTRKFRTEIVVQDMIMLDKRGDDMEEYIPENDHESGEHESAHSAHTEYSPSPVKKEQPVVETKSEEEKPPTAATPEPAPAPVAKAETTAPAEEKEEKKQEKLDIDSDLGL